MQQPYEPPLNVSRDRGLSVHDVPIGVSTLDALRFVFDDQRWRHNLLLGTAFLFIPMVGPIALMGWLAEVHQRLVRGHPRPIPKLELGDLSHYLGRGVGPFVAQLVVALPVTMLAVGAYLIIAFGGLAVGSMPGSRLPWLVVSLVLGGVAFLAWVGMAVVQHAAHTRVELTENLGDALMPGPLLGFLRRTWLKVLLSKLVFGAASLGLSVVGLLILCVGIYPVAVLLQIAAMHLRWQIYRYHVEQGGEPIAVKEPTPIPSEQSLPRHSGGFRAYTGY